MPRESAEIVSQRRLLGERLAAFREAAELTQGQLARSVFRHRTTVVHVEKGRRRADQQFWAMVDAAVNAEGALLAAFHEIEANKQEGEYRAQAAKLADARRRATGLGQRADPAWLQLPNARSWDAQDEPTLRTPAEAPWSSMPDSEKVHLSLLIALDEFLVSNSSGEEDRGGISEETTDVVTLPAGMALPSGTAWPEHVLIQTLRATLEHYITIDNLTGSRVLLPLVPQHIAFIEDLLANGKGRYRAQLLYVGARYAEFVGWLHQETGDLPTALRWSNTALQFAQAAGDDQLTSYIWMRKSNICSDSRRPDLTLAFARAALEDSQVLRPRLRAVALRQTAHAHAMAGDSDSCSRALDDAYEYASVADDEDVDLAHYCTPSYVEMEAAHCWVELGRPHRAIATLQRGLSEWRPNYRRDLGLCLARLAVAYAASEDPSSALAVAEHAVAIAADTRSHRTAYQLCRLPKLLAVVGTENDAVQLRRILARLQ